MIALLVAGTAFAVMGPLGSDDGGGHATPPVSVAAPAVGTATAPTCRSPLNPHAPLRLWIGGDSLTGSLGPSLGRRAGNSGVVQPTFDSRVSSGLLTPDFVNWPRHGAEDMALYKPEVSVFIIGANDAKVLPEGATRDPVWRARYSALVEQMLKVIGGNGRAVYWVGAPVMADAAYSARVQGVNDVFREVAAKHPDVTYVDAYSLFAAPDGTFASMLSLPDGKVARVRAADGIHFTPEGGDLLAETVFERLDAACRITEQAVPGEVKTTVEAPGSSSVPGSRRDPSTPTTKATNPATSRGSGG
ncbi:MAG TPA: DUF459 domain-containing protein [Acidimicrobiia bacterium]